MGGRRPVSRERLREARKAMGMTQAELGRRVGVARSTVCEWEKGRISPRHVAGVACAVLLGVAYEELFSTQAAVHSK